jgi:hypothetical protein
MYLCDDHRLARHWGEPIRQKGCYPGVQHRLVSACRPPLLVFFLRDVLLTLEICASRNVGLFPKYTEDTILYGLAL